MPRQRFGPTPIDGGLDYLTEPRYLDDSKATQMLNLVPKRGALRVRPVIGDEVTISAPAVSGVINGLHEARFEDGDVFLTLIDGARLRAYDGSTVYDLDSGAAGYVSSVDSQSPWSGAVTLNRYFACNGSNEVITWDGDTAADGELLSSVAGFTSYDGGSTALIARYVAGWAGRLFLGFTVEGGAPKNTRLRWSAALDFLEWQASEGAGSVDLADTPGEIVGLSVLNGQLIVYKTDSVWILQETGDPNFPFSATRLFDVGCWSGWTVQNIAPTVQLFMGYDDIYMMRQGLPVPIGSVIWPDIRENVDWSDPRRAVSWTIPEQQQYWLVIPDLNGRQRRAYCYDWQEEKWSYHQFLGGITAAARVATTSGVTVDSVSDQVDTVSLTLDSFGTTTAPPETFIATNGKVGTIGDGTIDIGSFVVSTPRWVSKEFFFVLGEFTEVVTVYMDISMPMGTSCDVSLSVADGRGGDLAPTQTKTAEGGRSTLRFYMRRYAESFVFRLSLENLTGDYQSIEIHAMAVEVATRAPVR